MLYFVRHGESVANLEEIFAGQRIDSPLTKKGEAQAAQAGQKILDKGLKIDRIVSSPLKRAFKTIEIISEIIGFPIEDVKEDDRLSEYDMGALTGQTKREISALELISADDAEDIYEFMKRVSSIIEEYLTMSGNTLMSTHAGVMRIIKSYRDSLNPEEFYEMPTYSNGHIFEINQL